MYLDYSDLGLLPEWRWYFVSPDGSKHDLGEEFSWPPNPPSSTFRFSSDTTYYVAYFDVANGKVTITDGTGIRYTLAHEVTAPDCPLPCTYDWREIHTAYSGWYVTMMEDGTAGQVGDDLAHPDRYPNWMEVEYEPGWDGTTGKGYGQAIKAVRDSLGREILFGSDWDGVDYRSVHITTIDLPKFAGSPTLTPATARYSFDYSWVQVPVPFPNVTTGGYDIVPRSVNRLDRIHIPGGYKIAFSYSGSELEKRTLPMAEDVPEDSPSGWFEYDYTDYRYYRSYILNGGSTTWGKPITGQGTSATGITRQILEKRLFLDGDSLAPVTKWQYFRQATQGLWTPISNPPSVTVRVIEADRPMANDTVHYFHASLQSDVSWVGDDPSDGYSPEWNDGLNYRTEYWEGAAGQGKLVRTEETNYTPDMSTPTLFSKSNIRPVRTTTTYNDDADKQVVRENSEWDGHGHWKVTRESGYGTTVSRMTRKEYASHGPRTDTIDYQEVSGGMNVFSRTDYEYDNTYGRLKKSIQRKTLPATTDTPVDPTNSLAGDVVTSYVYDDTSGNVTTKTLADGATPASPAYTINYTYNHPDPTNPSRSGPYLETKQFSEMNWKAIDWRRDGNTGRIYQGCDTAGICTAYNYDELGRITQILPPWPEYATAISYPTLKETNVWQWSGSASFPTTICASTDDCIYTQYLYDDLARLVETRKRDAAGETVHQVTTYDGLSNVLDRSEWAKVGDPLALTTYDYTEPSTGEQDPFGRAWKVTTPDGKVTRTFYSGQSTTVTVDGIQGPDGNPLNAKTSYAKDALGRLIEVSSPTAQDTVTGDVLPADAVRAVYTYDLGDNLTQVDLVSPQGTHQFRTFVYDPLNRFLREENPESGTTLYQDYDPLGNLLQKQDNAGNVLKMTYDSAGRLIDTLRQSGSVDNPLVHNIYDQPSAGTDLFGFSAGKLTTVQSFDDAGVLQLTQKTHFQGLNGRPSGMATVFAGIAQQYPTMTSYNSFGLPATMNYPYDGIERPVRALLYGYINGFLRTVTDNSQVPPFPIVKKITYNPAGGVAAILLGGDVQDTVTPDLRNRPGRIQVQKIDPVTLAPVADYWDTGGYLYDGAGNIAQIGTVGNSHLTFGYDASNRLVRADIEKGTTPGPASYYQADYNLRFTYDPFGNMISRSDLFAQTSRTFTVALTNRMADLPFHYDANGNVTEDDQNTYRVDARNRVLLIFTTGGDPQLAGTYQYDAAGQRAVKETGSAGLTTFYVRDGQGQVLSEFTRPTGSGIPPLWSGDYISVAGRTVAMTERNKPDPPTGLYVDTIANCADPSQGLQVNLKWRRSAETDVSAYQVYRNSALISSPDIPAEVASYSDGTVTSGLGYAYQLKAKDPLAVSDLSAIYNVQVCDTTPPGPPGLSSPVVGDSRVSLNWTGSTTSGLNAVIGYHVYQGIATDGVCPGASDPGYAALNAVPLAGSVRDFVDLTVSNGTTYCYFVRARDAAANLSGASDIYAATPFDADAPAPPRNLRGHAGCSLGKVSLTWDRNNELDLQGYKLYRSDTPAMSSSSTVITDLPRSSLVLPVEDTVTTEPVYYYAVKAYDTTGNESSFSAVLQVRIRQGDPAPPTGLAAATGSGEIRLNWTQAVTVNAFTVYRRPAGATCADYQPIFFGALEADGGIFTYTDYSIANLKGYDYVVSATGSTGSESLDSLPVVWAVGIQMPSGIRQCYLPPSPPYPHLWYEMGFTWLEVERFEQPYNVADAIQEGIGYVGFVGYQINGSTHWQNKLTAMIEPEQRWFEIRSVYEINDFQHCETYLDDGATADQCSRGWPMQPGEPAGCQFYDVCWYLGERHINLNYDIVANPGYYPTTYVSDPVWVATPFLNAFFPWNYTPCADLWPPRPTNVTATYTGVPGEILVEWSPPDGDLSKVVGYQVILGSQNSGMPIEVPPSVRSVTLENQNVCGTTVSWWIDWVRLETFDPLHVNSEGGFTYLDTEGLPGSPLPPANVQVVPGPGDGEVTVSWQLGGLLCQTESVEIQRSDGITTDMQQVATTIGSPPDRQVHIDGPPEITKNVDYIYQLRGVLTYEHVKPDGAHEILTQYSDLTPPITVRALGSVASLRGIGAPGEAILAENGGDTNERTRWPEPSIANPTGHFWSLLDTDIAGWNPRRAGSACYAASVPSASFLESSRVRCDSRVGELAMQPYRVIGILPVCKVNCGGGGGYVPPSFQWRILHTDHLGTPRIITDASGNIVSEHHYLPFGEEVPPSDHNGVGNLSNNSHRFTGHERDAETGLDYMLARYYEASLGRFLAVDPSSESIEIENPQTWNRYTYALNNPLRFIDPDGLEPKKLTADDIKKAAEAAKAAAKEGTDPVELANNTLNALGDFSASGADVAQGLKDAGIELPKEAQDALGNVDSVTKEGDKVTVQNKDKTTIDNPNGVGSAKVAKTVTFKMSGSGKTLNVTDVKGVKAGVGPFKFEVQGATVKSEGGKVDVTVKTSVGDFPKKKAEK